MTLVGPGSPTVEAFAPAQVVTLQNARLLMTVAVMVTMFDVELDGGRALRTDPRASGLGAQRPKHKVPFKIRKRTEYQL